MIRKRKRKRKDDVQHLFVSRFIQTDSMTHITTIESEKDILSTLALQQENLRENVSIEEQTSDGFVVLKHRPELLRKMNDCARSIIAKDSNSQVIGYALTMLPRFASDIPELAPLFFWIDQIEYKNQPLRNYTYYILGQVCVKKSYRGQKIFQKMLDKHRQLFSQQYELLITLISSQNPRSLHAHANIGFQIVHQYNDVDTDETWHIVIWQWSGMT